MRHLDDLGNRATLGQVRRIVVGASVLMAAIVVAAASSHASTTIVPAKRCTVVIYFTVPVTSGQIGALKVRLRRDPQAVAFRFVARARAR